MLPSPVSAPRQKVFFQVDSPQKRILDALLKRSRVTNLGIWLLSCICLLSISVNLRLGLGFDPSLRIHYRQPGELASGILKTISRPYVLEHVNHLIIVPCHAIWKGIDPEQRLEEDEWILEPYQKGGNRLATFFQHIVQGAGMATMDEGSLLVFSGGQTRPTSATTEAESYLRLATEAQLLNVTSPDDPFVRVTTENYALDSFQNLLYSIARFHEYTGHYPETITIIGYEFKKARYIDLHRNAIRWPRRQFDYIGIDPEYEDTVNARIGEEQNGYIPYTFDMYGCHSSLLSKRRQRNLHTRFHSYYVSNPELIQLFNWCPDASDGGEFTLFPGDLPWDHLP